MYIPPVPYSLSTVREHQDTKLYLQSAMQLPAIACLSQRFCIASPDNSISLLAMAWWPVSVTAVLQLGWCLGLIRWLTQGVTHATILVIHLGALSTSVAVAQQ